MSKKAFTSDFIVEIFFEKKNEKIFRKRALQTHTCATASMIMQFQQNQKSKNKKGFEDISVDSFANRQRHKWGLSDI